MNAGPAKTTSISALSSLNFRRYFAGQLLSTLGTWLQITAQLWLVLELSDDEASIGRLAALQFLPSLVFGAWAGSIADRFDNRKMLLVTNTIAGAFALALGLLSVNGSLTVGWLYVAALGVGLGNAFDRAAGPAFVTSLVPKDDLVSAIGLYSVTTSASRMVGIAVAGVLLDVVGPTICFLLNATSYLVVLASLLSLRSSEITDRREPGVKPRIRDGIAHIRSRPILWRTLAATTGVGMIGMNFMILVPTMVKVTFDASSRWFGIAEVFSGAGSTVAGFAIGRIRQPDTRTVGVAAIALGAATIATGLTPHLILFSLMMFLVGVAATGFMTTSMTVTQSNALPSMRGRVSALQVVANSGVMPIGSLAVGQLMSSSLGVRRTMVLTGSSAILVGAVVLVAETLHRSERWFDDANVATDAPPVGAT